MLNADAGLPWLVTFLLLLVRFGVALGLSPALGAYGVPALARLGLVAALAALACSALGPAEAAGRLVDRPEAWPQAVGAELLLGALLGLGVHVVLAGFSLAGRLMDVQIGFGIGSVFDPLTQASANVMGSLMSLIGVALFFIADAHLAFAGMLAESLRWMPLGAWPAFDDPLRPLLAAGSLFTFGLALAAPVLLALLLTDVVVGVASRNLPQVNVLVLGMPIKIVVGYFVLSVSVAGWAPLVRSGFGVVGDVLGARR